jgi:thymidylate synthase
MKKYHDKTYLQLIKDTLNNGIKKGDRTGTGTISYPFQQMRFDLSDNSIPLLTTKKMFTKGIIHEILWYLQGNTNINYLNRHGVHIWDAWADSNGDLGPVYGAMWREWPGKTDLIDQIANVINTLKTNPNNRRIIISAWNPDLLPDDNKSFEENVANGKQALPPCHAFIQFWSDGKGHLRSHLYQRSCDVGLGVPFNIVQYSILTHMIAQVTDHKAVEFVWTGGDVHIYNNHIDILKKQIYLIPFESPTLLLNPEIKYIDDFTYNDFTINKYRHHRPIKMEISV